MGTPLDMLLITLLQPSIRSHPIRIRETNSFEHLRFREKRGMLRTAGIRLLLMLKTTFQHHSSMKQLSQRPLSLPPNQPRISSVMRNTISQMAVANVSLSHRQNSREQLWLQTAWLAMRETTPVLIKVITRILPGTQVAASSLQRQKSHACECSQIFCNLPPSYFSLKLHVITICHERSL